MSEQVNLYKFGKRVNSTKRAHNGTTVSGNFRGPIDVMTPSIDIKMTSRSFDYNYLTWYDSANDLTRYYWIRHKVYYPDNIVNITLEEDVLATFQDDIENSVFFVERSEMISSGSVTDTAQYSENGIDFQVTTADEFEHYGDGWYVVGIAGSYFPTAFAESGGVFYYLCDARTVFNLLLWLNNDGASGEWADYDPISRVVSIRYFPISFDDYAPSQMTIQIFTHSYDDGTGSMITTFYNWTGTFVMTTGIPGIIHDVIYTKSFNMTFSNHSQYNQEQGYLNFPPYREVILYAGPFGKIDIPINLLSRTDRDNKITVDVVFDLISGLTRIDIYLDTNKTQLVYTSEDYCMSVDCAITSQSYNKYSDILSRDLRKEAYTYEYISKGAAGVGSIVAGAATSNPLLAGSGVALLASAAGTLATGLKQYTIDSYNLSIPDAHTKGTNGSYSMIEKPWKLYTISHRILDFPFNLFGYSCNSAVQLIASIGYTRCIGASFQSDKATLEEIVAINDFLNNGFYNELAG